MQTPPRIDPATQLDRFFRGVALLGGTRSAAAALGVTSRTIERLHTGQLQLHQGYLTDLAAALLIRSDQCRELERELSPAFAGNLTSDQATRKPHGNSFHLRGKD